MLGFDLGDADRVPIVGDLEEGESEAPSGEGSHLPDAVLVEGARGDLGAGIWSR